MAASPTLDDDIARHDDVLRKYREQFDEHAAWLHRQRDTPSFLPQGAAGAGASDDDLSTDAEMDDLFTDGAPRRPKHEELLERGKLYQQRKEALKEEVLRKELQQMRSTPKISLPAQRKHYELSAPQRFTKQEEERQLWLLKERQKRDDDVPAFDFKPRITKKGRSMTPRVRASAGPDQWLSKRKATVEKIQQDLRVQELAECRPGPLINENSERLVARRKARDESVHGATGRGPHYTHADSLLERDRLSKLQMWERYQQHMMEQQPGNPKITPFAAALDRGIGSACDRLYEQSFMRDERRSVLQQARVASNDGGECYHTPRITAFAASLHRDVPVEDALLERHEVACTRRNSGMQQILDRERDMHRPVINPVSDEIAARLPQTARERLYSGKTDYSRLQFDKSADMTSPPQKKSVAASNGSRRRSSSAPGVCGGESFYRRGERRKEQAQTRLENLRRVQDQKAMEECTFTPATCGGGPRRIDPLAIHDRGTQWQRRREQKLHDERSKREGVELAQCTFAPFTLGRYEEEGYAAPTPVAPVTSDLPEALPWRQGPDTELYGGDGRAWGYDEFVERHREARRRKMEKHEAAWCTGKGWKNEVTVPQEFNLGRPTGVASLQKPLSPPRVRSPGDSTPSGMGRVRGSRPNSSAGNWSYRDMEPAAIPAPGGSHDCFHPAAEYSHPGMHHMPEAYPVSFP